MKAKKEKRICATCANFDREELHPDLQNGYCDWVGRHLVDDRVPSWVIYKNSRPRMALDREDCGAWAPIK
jgi:hypothetical protein